MWPLIDLQETIIFHQIVHLKIVPHDDQNADELHLVANTCRPIFMLREKNFQLEKHSFCKNLRNVALKGNGQIFLVTYHIIEM